MRKKTLNKRLNVLIQNQKTELQKKLENYYADICKRGLSTSHHFQTDDLKKIFATEFQKIARKITDELTIHTDHRQAKITTEYLTEIKAISESALIDLSSIAIAEFKRKAGHLKIPFNQIVDMNELLSPAQCIIEIFIDDLNSKLNSSLNNVASPDKIETTYVEENVFQKKGDFFTVVFMGKVIGQFKAINGMKYIAVLLENPRKSMSALELYHIVCPPEEKLEDIDEIDLTGGREEDSWDEFASSNGTDTDHILDDKSISQFKQRLREIDIELDEALKRKDLGKKAKLIHDKEFILSYLNKNIDKFRKSRTWSSPYEKARNNVGRSIRTAIKKINDESHAFAEHLRKCIPLGKNIIYEPEKDSKREISWLTNKIT